MEPTLPVIATTGASTFLQAGVARLADAVHAGTRFVLVILRDNIAGQLVEDSTVLNLVRSCGVEFVREISPCDPLTFRAMLAQAAAHARSTTGGIAVIIATRPCVESDSDTAQVDDCGQCYKGYQVEPVPTSIFELAQQVALERQVVFQQD